MRRISSGPALFRLNGCGLGVYGRRDFDRETGTYVKTYCISVFFIPVLALMLLPTVVAQLIGSADGFALFITLVIGSVVAYVVRERRLPHRPTQRSGRAERTPVLPRQEQEE